MRRTQLYFFVALLFVSLGSSAHAQSGLADIQPIKPVMMLLVDTSGSMERMPDTSSCVDCMPACTNTASDVYQKNRWAVTLEALTGTFNNFRCVRKDRSTYTGAFDQDYFLPHYDFTTGATQASDGVLDTYKSRLKFGLMTFDGILTTVNGATLVPYANYASSSTLKAQIDGTEGMYSYPNSSSGWKQLLFPGCDSPYGVNAGARAKGTVAGSLISVGLTDSGTDVQAVNGQIQSALLQVRPYGGTPIAGMLDDLQYYLQNDTDIKSGSDPYATCRKRYAVLLTDGAPDSLFRGAPFNCDMAGTNACGTGKACICPYDKEEQIAGSLRTSKLLTALWVLAFNVNDTNALSKLDLIAQAGGKSDAFRALTPASLRAQLDSLMDLAQPDATSRSVPLVVNTGKALLLGGKQFEISAGFNIGTGDDEPWDGRLFRRRIECNGATPTAQDLKDTSGDLFHVALNSQSTRQLYTVAPTGTNVRGSLFVSASTPVGITASKVNTLRPDANQFSSTLVTDSSVTSTQTNTQYQLSLSTFDKNISTAYFGDANANGTAAETGDRDTIDDYLRGTTGYRKTHKLGDIYHSNPVVLPPVFSGSDLLSNYDQRLVSYYKSFVGSTQTYYDKDYGRPGIVFVGTNDGILHAFNLDTWKDKTGQVRDPGYEFWGFVPPALFDKLATMVRPTHQFMFDGTPLVKDVILGRDTNGASKIATVLVAALRGAPAFVALDITHPESPTFLWQRSFGYEGDTLGMPTIAHAKLTWQSTDQIRAVAILPGGDGVAGSDTSGTGCAVNVDSRGKAPVDARDNVRCWNARGRSLYVVDVATGELVQEFDARHFPSPLTGAVAVDGQDLALSRAAYFTDADGVLWRLSMINKDPSKWRVVPLWDLYGGEARNFSGTAATVPTPTYKSGRVAPYPPLLARDPSTGNLTIVFGTGDVDNLVDNVPHRVASLTEVRSYASDGELAAASSTTIKKNWILQLDTGESVTGPLVMLDDAVYFATFKGPAGGSDACEIGTSRQVGADVRATQTNGLPKARLRSSDGSSVVLQETPSAGEHSLLLGLSIARDPVCIQGTIENDPANTTPGRWTQTGNAGGGSYQMRSMVAGGGGTEIAGSNPSNVSGQGQRMMQRTLPTPNVARSVGWASSIE